MPSKADHQRKAQHDEQFVSSFDLATTPFLDWVITALFYSGLHYVEAYFATRGLHSADHRTRDSAIQRDVNIKQLYDDYSELKNFSINARYYMVGFTPDEVRYLQARLEAIRRHVSSYLIVAP